MRGWGFSPPKVNNPTTKTREKHISINGFINSGCSLGPPARCPLSPFLGWEISPTTIDYRKKGTRILTSLLEYQPLDSCFRLLLHFFQETNKDPATTYAISIQAKRWGIIHHSNSSPHCKVQNMSTPDTALRPETNKPTNAKRKLTRNHAGYPSNQRPNLSLPKRRPNFALKTSETRAKPLGAGSKVL